jgi:hypothetical protein
VTVHDGAGALVYVEGGTFTGSVTATGSVGTGLVGCTVSGTGEHADRTSITATATSASGSVTTGVVDLLEGPGAGPRLRVRGEVYDLACRLGGGAIADMSGPATVGGAAGYVYTLHLEDRGSPGSGEPDYARMLVFDSRGALVELFDGDVTAGTFVVDL